MLNLFFGFNGRLRRREFLLWSFILPCVLILPVGIASAASSSNPNGNLIEDLQAAGMVWPFFLLISLSQYISVALFWKRMNDVERGRRRRMLGKFTSISYAVLTGLTTLTIGLNMIALGQIEGSASGYALMLLWSMLLFAPPENGPNEYGDDPRTSGGWFTSGDDAAADLASTVRLNEAMEQALVEKRAIVSDAASPPVPQRPMRAAPRQPAAKPSFGKRN